MKTLPAIVSVVIEPKNKADQDKVGMALRKLLDEGLSFGVKFDQETSQTIISARSELQLESIVDCIKGEGNLDCNFGCPEVVYREGITKKVTGIIGKYDKGHVVIDIEPGEPGAGLVFVNKIKDGIIPHEFISSIKEGIEFGAQNGILSGYPVSDFVVTLVDASCQNLDSKEVAFHLGRYAIKEAFQQAGSVYQEPIMALEILVPDDYWGIVTSDLMKRRGQIKETGNRDKLKSALVDVPLAQMLGYSKVLNQLTKGQASFSMEFSFYAIAQNKPNEGTSGMAGKISPKVPPHLGGKAERLFEE